MRPVAIFADQLTCERTRGMHKSSYDGDAPEERFEGVFSAISDFHEKMNFLQVCCLESQKCHTSCAL